MAHGMQWFDHKRARVDLVFTDSFDVMAQISIGKMGAKEYLLMNLQKKKGQNGRKPVREIVMEKRFTEK